MQRKIKLPANAAPQMNFFLFLAFLTAIKHDEKSNFLNAKRQQGNSYKPKGHTTHLNHGR